MRICDELAAAAAAHGVSTEEGFLLQEQVSGFAEMIVGFRNDPALGPAVLVGAGGTLAEIYEDIAMCVRQTEAEIRSIMSLRRVLQGYRGSCAVDIDAFVEAIRFTNMCDALGSC